MTDEEYYLRSNDCDENQIEKFKERVAIKLDGDNTPELVDKARDEAFNELEK